MRHVYELGKVLVLYTVLMVACFFLHYVMRLDP